MIKVSYLIYKKIIVEMLGTILYSLPS